MKKIKILKLHTKSRHNAYNYLVEMLEIKDDSNWCEVSDEEFKSLTSNKVLDKNYIILEHINKDKVFLDAKTIIENLAKEEAAKKAKERERLLKIQEEDRKRKLLAEEKKRKLAQKRVERARKVLADAGEL